MSYPVVGAILCAAVVGGIYIGATYAERRQRREWEFWKERIG